MTPLRKSLYYIRSKEEEAFNDMAAQTGSNDDIKQRMIDDVKVIVYDLF